MVLIHLYDEYGHLFQERQPGHLQTVAKVLKERMVRR